MPVEVKMPQLGESVVEGTISRWLKQPGEPIKLHEPLLEVTTDKVDTEIPSTIDGTVVDLLIPEGETVKVGTVIARLATPDERVMAEPVANGGPTQAPASMGVFISPGVARLAAERKIDLGRVQGTGAGGRVTKKDLLRYIDTHETGDEPRPATQVQDAFVAQLASPDADETRPTLAEGDELVPVSPLRRSIAEHMARSKRVAPHVTTVMEADLTRVAAHLASVKAEYARQGARLTYTPYFVEATVAALREAPVVNASFRDGGIEMHDHINVGVAVALADGLIVPVIRDAGERSLLGLARAVNDLAERARTRRLRPADVEGATFTISNHGVSGSLFATPIINQPQAAILGVGAIEKRAVVISDGGFDAIAIRLRCYLSLTFDHRLIDGATADQFLAIIKGTLDTYPV